MPKLKLTYKSTLAYGSLGTLYIKHKVVRFELVRTITDRNFVAKYSQQVLHFDHEVTYYLQSINDSGQSTQN